MKKILFCFILLTVCFAQLVKAPTEYNVICREKYDDKYCLYVLDKKANKIYAIYNFDVLLVKHDYDVKKGEVLGIGNNIKIESVEGI